MGLSIAHTMNNSQFENKENLRQAARNILSKQGASQKTSDKMIQDIFGNVNLQMNTNLISLIAANQFSVNNQIKESLIQIKKQAQKPQVKNLPFGELWSSFQNNLTNTDYNGELCDFEIDESAINIFIAA